MGGQETIPWRVEQRNLGSISSQVVQCINERKISCSTSESLDNSVTRKGDDSQCSDTKFIKLDCWDPKMCLVMISNCLGQMRVEESIESLKILSARLCAEKLLR
uniref:Uncharacterized protein n=1 Tax=Opuntia streptacantha TaxID=393608 RepID=A0A7C9EEP4_OPUST